MTDTRGCAETLDANLHYHGTATSAAHLPCLHLALQGRAALVGGDVVHQRLYIGNGSDRQQIHAEDDAPAGHVLGGDLAPPTRGCTQVDAHLRRAKEVILLVDLERGHGKRGKSLSLEGTKLRAVQAVGGQVALILHGLCWPLRAPTTDTHH